MTRFAGGHPSKKDGLLRSGNLTPLQVWSAAHADLFEDARAALGGRAWRMFVDVILTRAAREITELDADAWRRSA